MNDGANNNHAESADPATAVAAKKRPLFQFHLSTAIVLMFVAGGLMWASIAWRGDLLLAGAVPGDHEGAVAVRSEIRGFPFMMDARPVNVSERDGMRYHVRQTTLFNENKVWNIAFAAIVLVAVFRVCEAVIRRKERRQ